MFLAAILGKPEVLRRHFVYSGETSALLKMAAVTSLNRHFCSPEGLKTGSAFGATPDTDKWQEDKGLMAKSGPTHFRY